MSTESLPATATAPPAPKRSAVEGIKESSRQLRGTIADELASGADHFCEASKQLIKFHGSYQQEDRDARKSRRKDGVGKYYMFMIRCKIPGGRLTAEQYLAVDRLAGDYANGTLRFTTRQGIQLHGVLITDLKQTIAAINGCLLSTLGACGDVERNVMACPAPCHHTGVRAEMQETAALIAAHLAPRTRGYHEIWLNGQSVGPQNVEPEMEPIYGKTYLPRKFKTGIGLPEDNCIDLHAQDLGLLAIVEDGHIVGYNVLVGGGMGMTHGNANTFPHLAQPICYVSAKAVVHAAEGVIKLFRDHGNRADRKRARIKYLVHDWGVEKFRNVLSDYVGGALIDPRPVQVSGFETHLGWHPQGDGKWYYGVSVENGRVKDDGDFRLRTALRTLVERLKPELRITAIQDILLCGLENTALAEIERTLLEHGVRKPEQLSTVRKCSMSCPAIPTCGLAISEAERALPKVIDTLEVELERLGLQDEKLSVRMTGCPNGCARPYQSDIGIVGRSGDKYMVFVGGSILGHRLNFPLRDLVPLPQIVPTLKPVLEEFEKTRQPGEGFGDFCTRLGEPALAKLLPPLPKAETKAAAEAAPLPAPLLNGEASAHAAAAPEAPVNGQPAPTTPAAAPAPSMETFFAGLPGDELPDYAFRYNSDGSVRETVVYYYSDDLRATEAEPGAALRREAVYLGRVNPSRLFAARKRCDILHVGPARLELRDRRVDYHPDGRVAQTVIFYYEGDVRAADATTGAALRRQACFAGAI